ncbi:hypothetical protein TIFTF001_011188 [Ficus carica]|uniref:Uncharacterized protein n=1 Tax=Ficus carica TaxID=3494 RepID=A0AA88ADK7_FICCA|nr:hypothetical protein TIFTF001_011188 [Ficus carica]
MISTWCTATTISIPPLLTRMGRMVHPRGVAPENTGSPLWGILSTFYLFLDKFTGKKREMRRDSARETVGLAVMRVRRQWWRRRSKAAKRSKGVRCPIPALGKRAT